MLSCLLKMKAENLAKIIKVECGMGREEGGSWIGLSGFKLMLVSNT